MKKPVLFCLLCVASYMFPSPVLAQDWVVRRAQMSSACAVQLKTASPLGDLIAGPFPTRKQACSKAGDLFDDSMTATDRCWVYIPQTIAWCKSDGVTLPPATASRKIKTQQSPSQPQH